MVDVGRIRGNSNEPLYVGLTTVYVRSNINKVEPPEDCPEEELSMYENLWEYDEVQYTKDEYIDLLTKRDDEQDLTITDLDVTVLEQEQTISEQDLFITELDIRVLELEASNG